MRLQVAIDRVNLKTAEAMIEELRGLADIIEVGTSLIKDYGLENSVARFKKRFPDQCFLADIKTCDEGAYEFRKSYEAGGDNPTVMGFSSITTIRACAGVAGELGKEYMIDLLEVPADRIRALCEVFPEAIFCIHLPSDKQGEGLVELVKSSVKELSGAKKIAVAGGVTFGMVPVLKSCGIEIGIVGSAITKSENKHEMAARFAEAVRG